MKKIVIVTAAALLLTVAGYGLKKASFKKRK